MRDEKNIVAAVDIGTSKILAVVAEISRDGSFRVLAQGRAESKGVEGGRIVDVDDAVKQLNEAINDLQRFYKQPRLPNVYATVGGKHVVGRDSTAQKPIKGDSVTIKDIQVAKDTAIESLGISDGEHYIASEINYYSYNNEEEQFNSPLEQSKASRVTVHVHAAVGNALCADFLVKTIRRSGLDIVQGLPQGWASAYAILTEEERRNGVVVVDVGASTTDVVVFKGGTPRFTKTLPIGGDHITEQLAGYMHCSMQEAEKLKRRLDLRMLPELDEVLIPVPRNDGTTQKYSLLELSEVALGHARGMVAEVCKALLQARGFTIENGYPRNLLSGGIVVTGGGSLLQGVDRIFEQVPEPYRYTFSTRHGRSRYEGDACVGLTSPSGSAVMGLVTYAALRFKEGETTFNDAKVPVDTWQARLKQLLKEFFIGEY